MPPQAPVTGATLDGVAAVVDGDTIEVNGRAVRIFGIDAPEMAQRCTRPSGAEWPCGRYAARALRTFVDGEPVRCIVLDKDKYDRLVAICRKSRRDVGHWMVAHGWAYAFVRFSDRYSGDERRAKQHRRGIWNGTSVPPWQFRAVKSGRAPPSPECAIKGNVNQKGERIYHVPGSRWYDETRISRDRDERWFCSEAEARAAGWRPARTSAHPGNREL